MEKKIIGLLLTALGILLILISISFTLEHMARGLELHKVCSLADEVCPFIEIPWQGMFSVGIGVLIIIVGIYMMKKPLKETEKTDMKQANEELKKLNGDEKSVYAILIEEGGMVFQSSIMEKTGFSKVKVTRVLDKLENMKLIERKRRGMTNVVVLK